MRASLADLAFAAVDGATSPADVAVVLNFAEGCGLSPEQLEAGAARANAAYPRATQRLVGSRWRDGEAAPRRLQVAEAAQGALEACIAQFLAEPFRLSDGGAPPQLLVRSGAAEHLVTRLHHAQADMQSIFLWLRAQLEAQAAPAALTLREHPRPARRSVHAPAGPSSRLAGGDVTRSTGVRAWALRSWPERTTPDGFTWNDLLAAIALTAVERWNAARGGGAEVGLWMPVGARVDHFAGFGNGSGRIRVYAKPFTTFAARARAVREQLTWSREHGEWATPRWAERLLLLPSPWVRWILRRQASSPGVDMGTTLFTHLQRLVPRGAPEPLPAVSSVALISHLLPAHPISMSAMGLRGTTHLTFTWDAGRFSPDEARAFIEGFEATRDQAFAELDHA
ncbi:MAG: hypothetical protein K1X89_12800 [Myxococcaceae bacterium]|nr:hypothetical protein [Myxococcaceae bacterium]